ncbi:MAG: endonuclease/exonuclease/phosphatase family protein [Ardenticatenaceae bacterium]|nr:endonuclease/exonuclease/phosphatase family protein [Anaerolineales bacterium]MCB8922659.1 endonuclease/exonuclease/phosphatase family protein [Ardenticatenaceae bacterium]MCB9003633.1 endonuclease/exonuclease/phosphatase family protein [Ardenticatenaceae bacterium]
MTSLRIATINLRNRANRWAERRHLLVAQLMDAAPDLISLQEIHFPIGQGRWLRNQINNRLTGSSKRPYRLIQKRKAHLINGYYEGVGILTKLPVLYTDWVNLGYGGRVALRVNVELPSRQALDFVAVHLHHTAHDKEARLEQVVKMAGWLNGRRRISRQVIAGDFNEIPTGPAIQYMKQGFRSAVAERWGHEPLATFPTVLLPDVDWAGCLDYIFLSPGAGVVQDARIFCQHPAEDDDTLYPSDHVGLLVDLHLPE